MNDSSRDAICALITVRSTSSRLPGKCFLSFGDSCVLEHVVLRTLHYGLAPIICTTRDGEDDAIEALAIRLGVRCYRGPTNNKLLRWSECCNHFGVEAFHSVDADDPFFCGEEVRRSFALLRKGLDMVAPSLSSSGGGATVGYSLTADIIARACKGLGEDTDTEMMWSYVDRVPGLRKAVLEDPPEHVIRARLTLDYHEDYVLLEAIRLLVGNMATRADIAALLQRNPDLQEINAFRTAEWSAKQKAKSLQIRVTNEQNS
jgi:spore coat polysaccharide biosynthesis protein SpsF